MTKSQVKKLGKRIRQSQRDGISIAKNDIELLQEYRTSFKQDISVVFEEVAKISKDIRRDSLTAFRIKRIESILSKIRRQPTMSLDNMGDIAGCRIIVHSKAAFSLIKNKICDLYDVTNVKDYVKAPKKDGYKGYHFYIKSPINKDRQVEIQLRHARNHKWASLVEIIDIVYNLKLKEGEKHEDFENFLYLLSVEKEELKTEDIIKILDIDSKHQIYKKLNQIFIPNNIPIRKSWLEVIKGSSDSYFIIEVDENKKSNIKSYENYNLAEKEYFSKFLENTSSNFVLIFIDNPKFREVCMAYASYMMIKHDYLDDWNYFASKILKRESKSGQIKSFNTYRDFVDRNLVDQRELIQTEINEINSRINNNTFDYQKGLRDWVEELNIRVKNINEIRKEIEQMEPPEKGGLLSRIFKK